MSLSSPGVGSGLDVNGIVSQLMALERQPLAALAAKESGYRTRLSALGTVKGGLGSLQTAAQSLAQLGTSPAVRATPGDSAVLAAAAAPGTSAGSHAVTVTQLARSQSLAAAGLGSASAPIGSGAATTVTIEFGTIGGGTFDADSGRYTGASFTADTSRDEIVVSIDAGNNTLEGIRDAINQAAGGAVLASIVHDGSDAPYRLVIASRTTGAAGSLRVSVDGDAALAALLAHDPSGIQNLAETASAANALFSVNGLAIARPDNVVTDALPGVTLTLKSPGSTSVIIERDVEAVRTALSRLVDAYNAVQGAIATATAKGATLQGDPAMLSVQRQLREAIGAQHAAGGRYSSLAQLGVLPDRNGKLAIDADRLDAALEDHYEDVLALFAAGGAALEALARNLTASDGTVAAAEEGIDSALAALAAREETLLMRIDAVEARYRAQFTALDTMIAGLERTSMFLQQQLAALDASRRGG